MTARELFRCDYPIYSVGRLRERDGEFYVAGGGGKAKTGVPNGLDIHRLCYESGRCVSIPIHHHDMETSVIMNSTTHPNKGNHIVVGVGGECCSMEVRVQEGTSRHGDADDVISSKKLKRRRKHSQSKDDKDGGVKSGQSHMVMSHARIQTDFSEECYQKVVMFTCDGERIVTGGSDGVVRVWEYPSLEKVCEFKGHENEIESISCHPSEHQAVSMCRDGVAIVWDLTNQDKEHTFTWSPGQQNKNDITTKPIYRFRSSCFSGKLESEDHVRLYTLAIPVAVKPSKKQQCYIVKWDGGAWVVEEERKTGNELLSALAIDSSGRYLGVGTITGGILIYSTDLKLISRVSGVHTVFVTRLVFMPLSTTTNKHAMTSSSSRKQVSNLKPDRLVLISVSADRTCSAIIVRHKSGTFKFIILFLVIPLVILLVAMATKHLQFW